MYKLNDKTQIALKLLSKRFRVDINSIRLNTHNKLEHELAKTKLAYMLIKDGKDIVTEAIFLNGCRADILVPSDMRVFEILHSETRAEAMAKTLSYPEELDKVYIESEEILKDDFEW